MMIRNTKRHPNNTKTDQLPISEVITGLPWPYHHTPPLMPKPGRGRRHVLDRRDMAIFVTMLLLSPENGFRESSEQRQVQCVIHMLHTNVLHKSIFHLSDSRLKPGEYIKAVTAGNEYGRLRASAPAVTGVRDESSGDREVAQKAEKVTRGIARR